MNTEIANKVETLRQLKMEGYQSRCHANPAVAAGYAVENILDTYKSQHEHLSQLLDEEIEDARKANAAR